MGKCIHLPFLPLMLVDHVITRYPEILSIASRKLCAYCLAVLSHLNTPTDNSSHLSSIRSFPVVHVFPKDFEIPFDLSKILSSLLLLKFLLACIMVNPISLVILLSFLVIIILSPLIQYVANAHNPQSNPRIHPSSSGDI